MSEKKDIEIQKQTLELTKEQVYYERLLEDGIDLKNRTIRFTGEIESGSFDFVDAALTMLENDNSKAITIKINCPGGEVYESLAIIGRLKASKCRIITEAYGHCMSAAVLILACGDKRRMSHYSWLMHHKASYGLMGDHDRIVKEVEQMKREEKVWATWMEELTDKDAKYWEKSCEHKNLYLSAEQCFELGVIDEII